MQLTKDADKLACSIYKDYLEKRKNGTDKFRAKHFTLSEIQSCKPCLSWSISDVKATVAELHRAGLGTMYLDGGFSANDAFIVYGESF